MAHLIKLRYYHIIAWQCNVFTLHLSRRYTLSASLPANRRGRGIVCALNAQTFQLASISRLRNSDFETRHRALAQFSQPSSPENFKSTAIDRTIGGGAEPSQRTGLKSVWNYFRILRAENPSHMLRGKEDLAWLPRIWKLWWRAILCKNSPKLMVLNPQEL